MENETLEKLCNKIVDVAYEVFMRKYYFVKISQSKKGHIYRENIISSRSCNQEKDTYIEKILFRQDLAIKKRTHILLSEKRKGDLLERKKTPFIKTNLMFRQVFLNGTVINMTFWAKNISLTQN